LKKNSTGIRRIGSGAILLLLIGYNDSLILGNPAQVVKELKPEQIEGIRQNAENYVNLAKEQLA
jgi:carbonic anhydrase/acetyltransferase-like protein (isoleucine patch superfamily)